MKSIISVLAACLFVLTSYSQAGQEAIDQILNRGPKQVVELPDSADWYNSFSPYKFAQKKNRVLVVNYWSPREIHAQETIDKLQAFAEKHVEIELLTVYHSDSEIDRDPLTITRNIRGFGIDHSVVVVHDMEALKPLNFVGVPAASMVLGGGTLVTNHYGIAQFEMLMDNLGNILENSQSVPGAKLATSGPQYGNIGSRQPEALVKNPRACAVDSRTGDIYIVDSGHHRVIVSGYDGNVKQTLGNGNAGFVDGPDSKARFNSPMGVAFDERNRILYVADTYNHAIRRIDMSDGRVTTVLGSGERADIGAQEVFGTTAKISYPTQLELRGGKLFIAMTGWNQIWEMDVLSNKAKPVAGSGKRGCVDGKGDEVRLNAPTSFAFNSEGKMIILDAVEKKIRQWDVTKKVETIFEDKDNVLDFPSSIAVDGMDIYVSDYNNKKIFKLEKDQLVLFAGTGEYGANEGKALKSSFMSPSHLEIADGSMYVSDLNANLIRTIGMKKGRVLNHRFTNIDNATRIEHGIMNGEKLMTEEVPLADGTNYIDITIELGDDFELLGIGNNYATMEGAQSVNELLAADVRAGKLTLAAPGSSENYLAQMELYMTFTDVNIPGSVYSEAFQLMVPFSFPGNDGTNHQVGVNVSNQYVLEEVVPPTKANAGRK